jgi:hypothetical protein
VTEPSESNEEREVRRWRMATRVIDRLIWLALAVIAALALRMIFF